MVPHFWYDTLPVFTKMPVEMGGESEDLRADAQGWALKKSPPKPWELTHLLDPFETVSSVAARFRKCFFRGHICNLAQLLPTVWKMILFNTDAIPLQVQAVSFRVTILKWILMAVRNFATWKWRTWKGCEYVMWIICKVFNHVELLWMTKQLRMFESAQVVSLLGLLHPTKS